MTARKNVPKDPRISVPISPKSRTKLLEAVQALGNSEAGLAQIILEEGIERVGDLVKSRLDALQVPKLEA